MACLRRALTLVVAACACLALAAPAGAAPAPVPCSPSGGGHFTCTWYPAGDGRTGGTPVLSGSGRLVGYLHRGSNWIVCQRRGGRVTSGPYFNSWWGWTLSDYGGWGWANAVWAHGGDNDGGFRGVPSCNGAHGHPPGAQSRPAPPPKPVRPPARPRYVALGDSYSSGEGAGSYYRAARRRPQRCHRSAVAYSQLLARRLRGRFRHAQARDFLACSGDEVPDLIRRQLPSLGADVGLVTVGIGGNDSGWTAIIKDCMLDAVTHTRAGSGKGCKRIIAERFASGLPRLRARLASAYRRIRARAPRAIVIVLGYPAIFEDSYRSFFCASVGPLTRGARSDLREGAQHLDEVIGDMAHRFGFRFVDPRAAFKNHRICSPGRDWIHGVTLEDGKLKLSASTFHPNAAGQAGFANAIAADNRDLFP